MGCSQGKSAAIQNGSTSENKPADKQNGVQQLAASTNDDNSGNVSEASQCTPGYLNQADLKYYLYIANFLH